MSTTRTSIVDVVAQEATRLRRVLIARHRSCGLGREDLEDLYSQATLELLKRAQRDPGLRTRPHVRNALSQKFAARVLDAQRDAAGRSPAAHARARAQPLDHAPEAQLGSARDAPAVLIAREALAELAAAIRELTADQRLVLHSQLHGEAPRDCQARTGWTSEKYYKVAQRARARLATATRARS